jgi:UDP-glucuronate 4-epimerase
MKILVTGSAGFIGYHLCLKLLENKNFKIYGLDNLNDYYDVNLKKNRNKKLKKFINYKFKKIDISNSKSLFNYIKDIKIDIIVNLAAQAGVRYSISHPEKYFSSNILGFFNLLDIARKKNIKHFLLASSSSVYGNTKAFKLDEMLNTDSPISFYAATKKSNEVLAYSYSSIYKIPITALRFFTVFGPYGRPDMAIHQFTKNIINNKEIKLYNYGKNKRDFTFIDDVIKAIYSLLNKPSKKKIPFDIYNIGSNTPYKTTTIISFLEKIIGKKANTKKIKKQLGDVNYTSADLSKIKKLINYKTENNLEINLNEYVKWFKRYYRS